MMKQRPTTTSSVTDGQPRNKLFARIEDAQLVSSRAQVENVKLEKLLRNLPVDGDDGRSSIRSSNVTNVAERVGGTKALVQKFDSTLQDLLGILESRDPRKARTDGVTLTNPPKPQQLIVSDSVKEGLTGESPVSTVMSPKHSRSASSKMRRPQTPMETVCECFKPVDLPEVRCASGLSGDQLRDHAKETDRQLHSAFAQKRFAAKSYIPMILSDLRGNFAKRKDFSREVESVKMARCKELRGSTSTGTNWETRNRALAFDLETKAKETQEWRRHEKNKSSRAEQLHVVLIQEEANMRERNLSDNRRERAQQYREFSVLVQLILSMRFCAAVLEHVHQLKTKMKMSKIFVVRIEDIRGKRKSRFSNDQSLRIIKRSLWLLWVNWRIRRKRKAIIPITRALLSKTGILRHFLRHIRAFGKTVARVQRWWRRKYSMILYCRDLVTAQLMRYRDERVEMALELQRAGGKAAPRHRTLLPPTDGNPKKEAMHALQQCTAVLGVASFGPMPFRIIMHTAVYACTALHRSYLRLLSDYEKDHIAPPDRSRLLRPNEARMFVSVAYALMEKELIVRQQRNLPIMNTHSTDQNEKLYLSKNDQDAIHEVYSTESVYEFVKKAISLPAVRRTFFLHDDDAEVTPGL